MWPEDAQTFQCSRDATPTCSTARDSSFEWATEWMVADSVLTAVRINLLARIDDPRRDSSNRVNTAADPRRARGGPRRFIVDLEPGKHRGKRVLARGGIELDRRV